MLKIGVCKVESNQYREESLHGYDLNQKQTTLCGLDLRFVTLLDRNLDEVELSCFTCNEIANKLNAKAPKRRLQN
ncbi:MAG: hypothetical protein M1587_09750 [Thaumarchaeota archaeon]|nr:hypothetical protein [Nitrososphaerota archaeon]